jgi:hypothetical protein
MYVYILKSIVCKREREREREREKERERESAAAKGNKMRDKPVTN